MISGSSLGFASTAVEGEGKGGRANSEAHALSALATFNKQGDMIYVASKGTITVLQRDGFVIHDVIKVSWRACTDAHVRCTRPKHRASTAALLHQTATQSI